MNEDDSRESRFSGRANPQATQRSTCSADRRGRGGKMPRSDLGTIDRGASFARPFDVHCGSAGHQGFALVLGSGGIRQRRRAGIGRLAPRGGRARTAGAGQATSESVPAMRSALASALMLRADGSFLFPGPRGTGQAGKEYGSCGESWGSAPSDLLSCIEEAEKLQP